MIAAWGIRRLWNARKNRLRTALEFESLSIDETLRLRKALGRMLEAEDTLRRAVQTFARVLLEVF